MAWPLEKHDCPSVPAFALRLSRLHLLTSWDCPSSLSWPLCKAEETEPFLPSQLHLWVRWWALVAWSLSCCLLHIPCPFFCRWTHSLPLGPPARQGGDTSSQAPGIWSACCLFFCGYHSPCGLDPTSHTHLTNTDRQPGCQTLSQAPRDWASPRGRGAVSSSPLIPLSLWSSLVLGLLWLLALLGCL